MIKSIDLQAFLLENAVRKPFGVSPDTSDIYTDKTEYSLWCWELICPQLHMQEHLYSKVKDHRLAVLHKAAIFKTLYKIV